MQVIQVAAGDYHTLLLTKFGEVFSFGCGAQGALGHGSKERANVPAPKRIERLATVPITQIAAGNFHSAAVTTTGAV